MPQIKFKPRLPVKWIAGFAVLAGIASSAHADDPKKDSLTVLPWTQATLLFSSDEKLGVVEFSQLFKKKWGLNIKASAPIDKDTRVAAFVDDGHLSSGFTGSFQIGYDRRAKQSARLADNIESAMFGLDGGSSTEAETAALRRRNLLLTAIPDDDGPEDPIFSISLDGRISYDRLSVYQDDLASKPVDNAKYNLGLGANFTYYGPLRGLALTARTGFDREQDSGADTVERCVQPPSSDGTVSGKQCDAKALFRSGDAPDAETSAYLRLAATYQYSSGKPSKSDLVPGLEARFGIEGLFANKSLDTRLTLFGTPVSGATAARVGVALDVSYRINIDPGEARWEVTPLIFVGATFSDLFGTHL